MPQDLVLKETEFHSYGVQRGNVAFLGYSFYIHGRGLEASQLSPHLPPIQNLPTHTFKLWVK